MRDGDCFLAQLHEVNGTLTEQGMEHARYMLRYLNHHGLVREQELLIDFEFILIQSIDFDEQRQRIFLVGAVAGLSAAIEKIKRELVGHVSHGLFGVFDNVAKELNSTLHIPVKNAFAAIGKAPGK